ncbi:MAG: hypothetical protein K940chlam6_01268 [Chlamydiae bacterium]|nr:hypothetical protein [Chlamydiota bacterium]
MSKENLITAIIYTGLDEQLGPEPNFWLPRETSKELLLHVSIKTITMLSAERGVTPRTLAFIPFAATGLKGIIKHIEWVDENRRGGTGHAAITIVFREEDDIIFYKYVNDLEFLFDRTAQQIMIIEESKKNRESINVLIQNLLNEVLIVLEEKKIEESQLSEVTAFPEKDQLHYQFKIIVAGDPTVGKTSTILRFTENAFRRSYIPTLGVAVSKKTINFDNIAVQLIMWDIAGQAKFEFMRTDFYKGAKAMFIVFDLTNPSSFDSVYNWYVDIVNHTESDEEMIGFVSGNKIDLVKDRKVQEIHARQLANQLNLEYFETSALTGNNIDIAFESLARALYDRNK